MANDVIPELALGYARLGGYEAAVGRANLQTRRDAAGAWLVGERDTRLIRNMTSKQVVAEYGPELADLNLGRRVSASQLGKGSWWKTRTGLAKKEPIAQAFGSDIRGMKLGEKAFIVHRETIQAAAASPPPPPPLITTEESPPSLPPALEDEVDYLISLFDVGEDEEKHYQP